MNILSPATTDHSQTSPLFRRSFTVPTASNASPRSPPSIREAVEEEAETLYAHHAGKIVSFNPPISGTRRHSSVEQGYSALHDEPVGTLPWASATERTLAAAKSQCWCVDGESKFVLQAGPHTYYRIELPNSNPDDRTKVDEFKSTLGKVLQYETTPCPFKRGFTVDLPEKPKTPVRKKPWQPQERPQPAAAAERSDRAGRGLRRWQRSTIPVNKPHAAGLSVKEDEDTVAEYGDSVPEDSAEGSENSHEGGTTDGLETTPRDPTLHAREDFDPYKTPTRPRTLKTGRATTAPPQLLIHTSLSDRENGDIDKLDVPADVLDETLSLSSSMDSFHSFHSPISPLPPSPRFSPRTSSPYPVDDEGITVPRARNHRRYDSELTVTAEPEDAWTESGPGVLEDVLHPASPEIPHTPTLVSDPTSQSEEPSPEVITPSTVQLRRRTKHSRQRSHSPLPSPANLYSPSSRLSRHHLTMLQKTCSMLLAPPVSLIALMLNIASRIMNGTYTGFSRAESSRKIPCSWEFSDTEHLTEEEDDYGCALDRLPSSRSSSRSKDLGGSWEID
ncbi:MAG: hypothetical protein L6R35_002655 [Caloplaca aegaea]|nr:MAG: hypothetical protein L6R35_002655 [Caloplaca aegaea]